METESQIRAIFGNTNATLTFKAWECQGVKNRPSDTRTLKDEGITRTTPLSPQAAFLQSQTCTITNNWQCNLKLHSQSSLCTRQLRLPGALRGPMKSFPGTRNVPEARAGLDPGQAASLRGLLQMHVKVPVLLPDGLPGAPPAGHQLSPTSGLPVLGTQGGVPQFVESP